MSDNTGHLKSENANDSVGARQDMAYFHRLPPRLRDLIQEAPIRQNCEKVYKALLIHGEDVVFDALTVDYQRQRRFIIREAYGMDHPNANDPIPEPYVLPPPPPPPVYDMSGWDRVLYGKNYRG